MENEVVLNKVLDDVAIIANRILHNTIWETPHDLEVCKRYVSRYNEAKELLRTYHEADVITKHRLKRESIINRSMIVVDDYAVSTHIFGNDNNRTILIQFPDIHVVFCMSESIFNSLSTAIDAVLSDDKLDYDSPEYSRIEEILGTSICDGVDMGIELNPGIFIDINCDTNVCDDEYGIYCIRLYKEGLNGSWTDLRDPIKKLLNNEKNTN